jgi:hypothetical protein
MKRYPNEWTVFVLTDMEEGLKNYSVFTFIILYITATVELSTMNSMDSVYSALVCFLSLTERFFVGQISECADITVVGTLVRTEKKIAL